MHLHILKFNSHFILNHYRLLLLVEILEKFEESTIDERNLLNARQTEVLEQMQSPSVVPTTHPNASSTTSGFEALLPTIPRPTALEETLSDEEELLGEISPTTSNKVS